MYVHVSVQLIYVILLSVALVNAVCPGGWESYRGVCYLFVNDEKATWQDANDYCHVFGGQLVELAERDRDRWVANRAMQIKRVTWWIGLNDIESENNWIWAGSRRVASRTYTNWHGGEPNGGRSGNCVDLNGSGNWNDDKCRNRQRFICERSEFQSPYGSSRLGGPRQGNRGRLVQMSDVNLDSGAGGVFDTPSGVFDTAVGGFSDQFSDPFVPNDHGHFGLSGQRAGTVPRLGAAHGH